MGRTEQNDSHRDSFREYATAIYILEEEGIERMQARIADWLKVSRASVSEMVYRMQDEGLVKVGRRLDLTSEGRHLAEEVARRHRLSELFLDQVLGLPWRILHREALVWDLMISDDVEAAMWGVLGNPQTCPHGNGIPGSGYVRPKMKPVSQMESGEAMVLGRISPQLENDEESLDLLDAENIKPGTLIAHAGQSPAGRCQVFVHDRLLELPCFVAERLYVVSD